MQSEKTIEIIKSLQLQCEISGKVDGLSFYKWKGKNVYRKIGKPSRPASEAQLECRRKFAILQNLSKTFKPIIRETYNTGKKPILPANLFIKRNRGIFEENEIRTSSALLQSKRMLQEINSSSRVYRDADYQEKIEQEQPNTTQPINYSNLKLTRSNYPIPFTPRLIKHSEEIFTLKWDDFTKRYDTIALIIYSPGKGEYNKTEISINENQWHIEIPEEFQNTKKYYYLYCYHSKRKTYSESITLTPEDGADILWKIHKQKRAICRNLYNTNQKSSLCNAERLFQSIFSLKVNFREEGRGDMLRFTNLFPLGCLRLTFELPFYKLKEKNPELSDQSLEYSFQNFSFGVLPSLSLENLSLIPFT
ncbi:MAG: hypothetical protein KDK36_09155 [Leptospiraceae bacterium]|nr:hypothetical protein [Leptospiraceae bacterium]